MGGILNDNVLRLGQSGYGGSGMYNLANARADDIQQQFNNEQFEKQFGLNVRGADLAESRFADAQRRYADALKKWGFESGGGTLAERRKYFEDTTGFSQLPSGDAAFDTGTYGSTRTMPALGGRFINKTVNLSDPLEALKAARYARGMDAFSRWSGTPAGTMSPQRSKYGDVENAILNSLVGGRG